MKTNKKAMTKAMTIDDLAEIITRTLPTKNEMNARFDEVNRRIDKVVLTFIIGSDNVELP